MFGRVLFARYIEGNKPIRSTSERDGKKSFSVTGTKSYFC